MEEQVTEPHDVRTQNYYQERNMKKSIMIIMAILAVASVAGAKDYVYRDPGSSLESEGYKLFVSDKIIDTIDRSADSAKFCSAADENTAKHLGEIISVQTDTRLGIDSRTKVSYTAACRAYYAVVDKLKSADDSRRMWLLFGDSVTDDYAAETMAKYRNTEDASMLIEMKRLDTVSKYLEFFYTKNTGWRLTDYTFLSQAFKARKGKTLSPLFGRFVAALLTGNVDQALKTVQSIDLDNLGSRLGLPAAGKTLKEADSAK